MEKLRPCKVKDRSGLFHIWEQCSEILPPSPTAGEHGGGIISKTFAIVEFEDGSVERCEPTAVKFTDKTPVTPKALGSKPKPYKVKESKVNCPYCGKEENNNAILYEDSKNREYFVYCDMCQLETIGIYKSKTKALCAFESGEVKNISNLDKAGEIRKDYKQKVKR